MEDASTELKARLRLHLTEAMRGKRAAETRVIRTLLAAIDNAQAVATDPEHRNSIQRQFGDSSGEVARRSLSSEDLLSVLAGERDERLTSAQTCDSAGQSERAAELRQEADLISRYLAGLQT